jgi:hypothetical protein
MRQLLGVKLGIVLRQIENYTKFPIYQFLEISSQLDLVRGCTQKRNLIST